jgi:hypothetical protein
VIEEIPYNPLDKINLGESISDALISRKTFPLPPEESFNGAGIYAIYYYGPFEPYRSINNHGHSTQCNTPIYVGKAVPAGTRKGGLGLGTTSGPVLFNRLREHADSIREAENLDLVDFRVRYLVVDDIWIPLGEAIMIEKFTPVWNRVIDGFGNHDPGKGRYLQQRSPWDVLHPGRPWAMRCSTCSKSKSDIIATLENFIAKQHTK